MKYSNEHVRDIVESEGLGYAVQDYLSAERIADPVLARHWADAKKALDAIEKIL